MNLKQHGDNIDNVIYELAMYYENKGGTVFHSLNHEEILERAAQFKHRIRQGHYTIEELSNMVYGQFGPFKQKSTEIGNELLKATMLPLNVFDDIEDLDDATATLKQEGK